MRCPTICISALGIYCIYIYILYIYVLNPLNAMAPFSRGSPVRVVGHMAKQRAAVSRPSAELLSAKLVC